MKIKYSGFILFANGAPAPGVEVRIFDKDTSGKQDDDLTLSPGLSDEKGRFQLTYEPLRYLDFHTIRSGKVTNEPFNTSQGEPELRLPDLADIYSPYLHFNYHFNGSPRQHSAGVGIFQSKYRLPEYPAVEFLPSEHGFKFANSFKGYFLPFSTPAFLGLKKVTASYGLCGGMCSAAYDFALAGKSIPTTSHVPRQGSRLQRYLYQRQMDSLGGFGKQVIKVAQWTSMPSDTLVGTWAQTLHEFNFIYPVLDDKNPVILALIYEQASTMKELSRLIFNNHQVLAYAYEQTPAGASTIHVYDPNLPGRDDVVIQSEPVELGEVETTSGIQLVMGLRSNQLIGGMVHQPVRGFFRMPYESILPPKKLIIP